VEAVAGVCCMTMGSDGGHRSVQQPLSSVSRVEFIWVKLTYLLTPCSRVLLEKLTVFQLVKKSPHFMEPEGSLPHSQVPATVPNLSQLDPVHTLTSNVLKIRLNIIIQSTPFSSKWSLSLRFPQPKPCIRHSSPPYALHAPPISFSSLSSERYWASSTDH